VGVILLDLLRKHAAWSPDAACLSFEGETLTFRGLHDRSSRVANALLQRGLRPGDRVAIIARNAPVHFELLFGCAKIGAIMLPINWRLSPSEVAAILADADPTVVLVSEELQFLLSEMQSPHHPIGLNGAYCAWRDAASSRDPGRPIAPHDATLILYTSGTTGVPKGATISHDNLSYAERMAREMWSFTASSVNLVAMPLYHIGGIGYGMMALSQGGHTVLLQQPVPDLVIDAIRRHSVTHVFIVPAVLQMLVDVPGVEEMKLASLRRIIYGAAPISEMLLRRAIAVFGCEFDHAYGMTETAGTVVTLAPRDHDPGGPRAHRLRSCGLPVSWVELALVDPATGEPVPTGEVGEIRIRSRMNMLGYWRKPAETAATIASDGWLCTGDAAYRDADGYVYIRDRYKDMIVSGGENIYPTEIENVLCHHPDVAEVSVIGVPHDRWGETPKAIVVLRPDRQVSGADLIAFARGSLARYKCPTLVEFATALPRSAAGKVLKRELRALEAAKHAVSK
jgi:acyl-CoA synthetase (AMP-forming)/AMP-acid ligase II